MLHGVGGKVVQLDVVDTEDGKEEWMKRERNTSGDVVHEGDALVLRRSRKRLAAGAPP